MMMRFSLLSLLGLALFLGHPAGAASILFSNDVDGEVEPCGCRNNPAGGVERKQKLIETLHEDSLLQVDSGDLFFSERVIPEALKKQSAFQAETLLKAHHLLKHDAFTPGEKDFALGIDFFLSLQKKAQFHFLAANIFYKDALLIPASAIVSKKAGQDLVRIGLIGVVSPKLEWPKGLRVTDPIEAVQKAVSQIQDQVDFIVVLSHQGLEEDQELAKKVKGIAAILGAHTQAFLQEPLKVQDTLIGQTSYRNQYLGRIQFHKQGIKPESYELLHLDANYEAPLSPMGQFVSQFKKDLAKLNTTEEATFVRLEKGMTSSYSTFPQCSECHSAQFDFWRKTPHAVALSALHKKKQLHNLECLSCHTVGFGQKEGWSKVSEIAQLQSGKKVMPITLSQMKTYMERLQKAPRLSSKIKTGFSHAKKSTTVRDSLSLLSRSFAPVQCENCHGAGGDHPMGGASYSAQVSDSTCLKCHNSVNAPSWWKGNQPNKALIRAKRKLVSCPLSPLPN